MPCLSVCLSSYHSLARPLLLSLSLEWKVRGRLYSSGSKGTKDLCKAGGKGKIRLPFVFLLWPFLISTLVLKNATGILLAVYILLLA